MKAKDKEVASLPESIKETKPVDQSRRSFAKVGAAVVPVMMTLVNRPAWGSRTVNLCTQSGWQSVNITASEGVTGVWEKVDYTNPPGNGNSGSITEWEKWGIENGLTGEPFATWNKNQDVDSWKAFATQCAM